MSATFVPDTSVVVKWLRQGEVLAAQALALRAAYLDGKIELLAPDLLAYELANVLRYKVELSTASVELAVQSVFDMGLEWAAPTASLMRRAAAIARAAEVTVFDAAFAALAESAGATFVTADKALVRRLAGWPCVLFLGNVEAER